MDHEMASPDDRPADSLADVERGLLKTLFAERQADNSHSEEMQVSQPTPVLAADTSLDVAMTDTDMARPVSPSQRLFQSREALNNELRGAQRSPAPTPPTAANMKLLEDRVQHLEREIQLRDAARSMVTAELAESQENLSRWEKAYQRCTEQLVSANARNAKLEDDSLELEGQLDNAQAQVSALQQKEKSLSDEIVALRSERWNDAQKFEQLKSKKATSEANAQRESETLNNTTNLLRQDRDRLAQDVRRLEAEKTALQGSSSGSQSQEASRHRLETQRLQRTITTLTTEKATARTGFEQENARANRLQTEKTKLEGEIAQLKQQEAEQADRNRREFLNELDANARSELQAATETPTTEDKARIMRARLELREANVHISRLEALNTELRKDTDRLANANSRITHLETRNADLEDEIQRYVTPPTPMPRPRILPRVVSASEYAGRTREEYFAQRRAERLVVSKEAREEAHEWVNGLRARAVARRV